VWCGVWVSVELHFMQVVQACMTSAAGVAPALTIRAGTREGFVFHNGARGASRFAGVRHTGIFLHGNVAAQMTRGA